MNIRFSYLTPPRGARMTSLRAVAMVSPRGARMTSSEPVAMVSPRHSREGGNLVKFLPARVPFDSLARIANEYASPPSRQIPAFAGMTTARRVPPIRVWPDSRLRGNDGDRVGNDVVACAGMTWLPARE